MGWQSVCRLVLSGVFVAALGVGVSAQTATKKPTVKKAPAPAAKKAATPAPEPEPPAPPPPPPPPTDVRVRSRYTSGPQVSENTTYLKGPRQRVEFPGIVSIQQCDLGRTVLLNDAAKRFTVQAAAATPPPSAPAQPPMGAPAAPAKGGVVTFATTHVDTGERKPIVGLEARHVRTEILKQVTANACDQRPTRIVVDAWYVDLPKETGCRTAAATPTPPPPVPNPECQDRVETRTSGEATLGFPVASTTTSTIGAAESEEVTTTSMEVTELEITRLDATLFDVPPDYTQASSAAELVPVVAQGGSLSDALFGSTAYGTSQAAPKRPGIVRLGVLEPVNRTVRSLPTTQFRPELAQQFREAPYEALPLKGQSAAEVVEDATRLGCDYILFTEFAEVKTSKSSKAGGLLKAVAGDATPPRDSHEVKLDYRVYAVNATNAPRLTGSVKEKSGGGFTVGSAMRLAAAAGSMGMGFAAMRGYGLGMSPYMWMGLQGLGGAGGMGGGLAALGMTSLYDPRFMAMQAMNNMAASGAVSGLGDGAPPDQSEAELRQVVTKALDKVADDVRKKGLK